MGPEMSCLLSLVHKITNVPVVYMGGDVGIWMGGNPFLGTFEGVGPEISTFLGPNGTRYASCHFRAQKILDFRAHPSFMDYSPIQIRYIKSYSVVFTKTVAPVRACLII